jgi:hypothetical protein
MKKDLRRESGSGGQSVTVLFRSNEPGEAGGDWGRLPSSTPAAQAVIWPYGGR